MNQKLFLEEDFLCYAVFDHKHPRKLRTIPSIYHHRRFLLATSNNVGLLTELDEPVAYLRVPANTTTSVMIDGISFVYEPALKPI